MDSKVIYKNKTKKTIEIKGAEMHNLKAIDISIPKKQLVVITGLSGSGKSSLAFDTIYAEGQRRFIESLSSYARQFLGKLNKPKVKSIDGLSPAIAIDQKTSSRSPRSTVGTVTEIHDYLRLLWARIGISYCPICGSKIEKQSVDFIVNQVKQTNLNNINCYSNEMDIWERSNTTLNDNTLTINFRGPFVPRRGRINCSLNDNGKWRWFGVQFPIKKN